MYIRIIQMTYDAYNSIRVQIVRVQNTWYNRQQQYRPCTAGNYRYSTGSSTCRRRFRFGSGFGVSSFVRRSYNYYRGVFGDCVPSRKIPTKETGVGRWPWWLGTIRTGLFALNILHRGRHVRVMLSYVCYHTRYVSHPTP